MTQKLQEKYIAFVRSLSELEPMQDPEASYIQVIRIHDKARELHDELLKSGYGR